MSKQVLVQPAAAGRRMSKDSVRENVFIVKLQKLKTIQLLHIFLYISVNETVYYNTHISVRMITKNLPYITLILLTIFSEIHEK